MGSARAATVNHPCSGQQSLSGTLLPGATSFLFRITGDERRFRLSGIASARPIPLVGPLDGQTSLTLFPVALEADRYGRISVDVHTATGWLQGDLLAAGKALADPVGRSRACSKALLDAEARDVALSTNRPDLVAARAGQFTVIEGKVKTIGDRERMLYLNFGQKWREDVTASVAKTGSSRYRGNIAELAALAGKRVRLRGTVELKGGPLIRLFDESQIEILDDK